MVILGCEERKVEVEEGRIERNTLQSICWLEGRKAGRKRKEGRKERKEEERKERQGRENGWGNDDTQSG
jgi:hypothetical protein